MTREFILEDGFEQFLVAEYLKCGSIDQVLARNQYGLPISFAGYHRVLTKFGVIKSAGPNSKLSESLYLLSLIANYKIPLEKIYRRYAPASIRVSTNTIHRILHYMRLGLTRRQGVALLIENSERKGEYLMGNDMSLSQSVLGVRGDLSLPMGHSKTGEDPKISIQRVMQQEVFTEQVITQKFPTESIPLHPKPVMFINIADVRVSVYHLKISPKERFSSYKLQNLAFVNPEKIKNSAIRPGVPEIISKFECIKNQNEETIAIELNSNLNQAILALAKIGSK